LRFCYSVKEQSSPSFGPVIRAAPDVGLLLEFGVASGGTFNQICHHSAPRKVYGFDWFYGLPEYWNDDNPRGKFSTHGNVPSVQSNGEIVVGLIEETLEEFLSKHEGPVAFAHLDLDLYSSTKHALDLLAPRCLDGTVLLFDEIVGNPDHEERAFLEFLDENGLDFEFVTRRSRDAIAFRIYGRTQTTLDDQSA
jgi:hypothetical protein